MLKKVILFILLTAALFSSFSLYANAWNLSESEGESEAYYLYNFENELVMAQKNINKIIEASSTVKLMTACIALESGIDSDTLVTITNDMIKNVSGRFMGLKVGDKMTFGDLLYSMICASFNDAAQAIALTVSDNVDDFIKLMNQKAEALGMNSTRYFDITGLSSESQTTVEDIIKLSIHLSKNNDFVAISSTKSYQLSSNATCEYNKITNRSTLLSTYKGVSNFNTGSSSDDQDSAVIYLNNGKLSFLCIVMDATSSTNDNTNVAEKYANRLLYHGLYDYSNRVVLNGNKAVASLPVKYSISDDEVNIGTDGDISAYISDELDLSDGISYSYYIFNGELVAPLNAGDEVGVITVSQNGRFITSAKLVVKESVEKNTFLYVLDLIKSFILSKTFLFFIVFFLVLMTIYYFKTKATLDKMYKQGPRKTLKYYRK